MCTRPTRDGAFRLAPSFVRFALVGALATAVDFAIFNSLLGGRSDPSTTHLLVAATIGFTVATQTSYRLNARFTFKARRSPAALGRYTAVTVGGLVLHNVTLLLLRQTLDPQTVVALNAIKLGALSTSTVWNYLGYRLVAFRR